MEMAGREGKRFKFNIDLNHRESESLSIKAQKALLSPLTEIRGWGQTCKFGKSVDIEIATRYRTMLTDQILWTRGRQWQFLDFIKYKKSIADDLFERNAVTAAHFAYFRWFEYNYSFHHILEQLLNDDDDNLVAEYEYLRGITQISFNASTIALYPIAPLNERMKLIDFVLKSQDEILADTHLNLNHLIWSQGHVTMAYIHSRDWLGAKAALSKAISMTHHDKEFAKCAKLLDKISKMQILTTKSSLKTLQELGRVMCRKIRRLPILNRPLKQNSILPTTELERYTLKRLGYTGSLLEDRLEQKPGWTMDMNEEVVNRPFNIVEAEEHYQKTKASLDLKTELRGHQPEVLFGAYGRRAPTQISFQGEAPSIREMPLPPGAVSIDGSMIVEQADGTFRPAPGSNLPPQLRAMLRNIRIEPREQRIRWAA